MDFNSLFKISITGCVRSLFEFARIIFGTCCLSMIISIIFFIREIQISTNALRLHMSDMDVKID